MEIVDTVATIVIENVGKRNALTAEMWAQFEPILAGIAEDRSVSVVVLRGAGDDFSAGADIGGLDRILPEEAGGGASSGGAARGQKSGGGAADGGVMSVAENALAAFPKPTIAAIDGVCVGGGWELAGACDIRIASERSTFGITPSRLGIVYPLSGIERVVAIAGPAIAKHLLFTGELFPATAALGFGLVTKVLPNYGFWDAAEEFARTLASRSQYSIQATKEIIDAMVGGAVGGSAAGAAGSADVGQIAAKWQGTASDDRAIGVEAFRAKRDPDFTWNGGNGA